MSDFRWAFCSLSFYLKKYCLHCDLSTKKCYYALSEKEFLAPLEKKISNLENEIKIYKENTTESINSLNSAYNEFKTDILSEKQDFLTTYKETNGKIIEMVKSFIGEEGE